LSTALHEGQSSYRRSMPLTGEQLPYQFNAAGLVMSNA
jgi:hypothetical protein